MFSPATIPLIEARLFIVAPLDVVGTNHKLEITITAFAMNEIIILEPLQSQIQSFNVGIKHLSEIFPRGADETGLRVKIESEPEKNA